MNQNEAVAEALMEMAAEADEQHKLLKEIKGLLLKVLDEHNVQTDHTRDGFDRIGTRMLRAENRIGALELVTGK
jgi:hypothetical protein